MIYVIELTPRGSRSLARRAAYRLSCTDCGSASYEGKRNRSKAGLSPSLSHREHVYRGAFPKKTIQSAKQNNNGTSSLVFGCRHLQLPIARRRQPSAPEEGSTSSPRVSRELREGVTNIRAHSSFAINCRVENARTQYAAVAKLEAVSLDTGQQYRGASPFFHFSPHHPCINYSKKNDLTWDRMFVVAQPNPRCDAPALTASVSNTTFTCAGR